MTVYPGTQKVTFGRNSDTDYKSKRAAAMAQSGPNSYIQGVQSVMNEGPGEAVANSRSAIGAPTIMPNELMQGASSNYANVDSPGNQPLNDLMNQTGSVETQVSSTNVPQEDPQQMETNALERRLSMYRKAAGNEEASANDRSQTMRA
jgi:hypothetical protein